MKNQKKGVNLKDSSQTGKLKYGYRVVEKKGEAEERYKNLKDHLD
ncbi:hypothetical protein [Mesoflavibacter sp. CH_XMU1422-2]